LAWTGVHGADIPVDAHALAHAIVGADGRVVAAPVFQAKGEEEEESREEGAAQGEKETGEKEKGSQEETPPLRPFA
jgi:hypothetical protein